MSRFNAFTVRLIGTLALLVFPTTQAQLALDQSPMHRKVTQVGPTASESGTAHGEDRPITPEFGAAVAIRDGIAFVGISHAQPTARVVVYAQTATGLVRTATLTVTDATPTGRISNGFGSAITFRDGWVLIASHTFVHVFKRNSGVWTDVQKLAPPAGASLWSISAMKFENGILVIGSGVDFGDSAAHVYELANGKFVRRATLRASDTFPGDTFGEDVGVAGNVIVVGAPAHSAAYVFRRRSNGAWVETQKLIVAEGAPGGNFGAAVAIDRGMIIVGAPEQDCVGGEVGIFCGGSSPDTSAAGGAAYGFVPVFGLYTELFKLRPRSDEYFNYWQFGRRIAMFGKHIVIDAAVQATHGDPDLFGPPDGLTFTYTRDGSNVTPRGITLGYVRSDSIALANNWLLIGSKFDFTRPCFSSFSCFGEGNLFDLNRFVE